MHLPLDWKRNVHSKMSNVARTLSRSMQQDQMPNDIVGAAEFFASKATSFIIGHTSVAEDGASRPIADSEASQTNGSYPRSLLTIASSYLAGY